MRSDNGPEFVSKALLSWIVTQGIGTALIEPGKPCSTRRGELQRQVPLRVSETSTVSFARRGEGSDRRMAATLRTRMSHRASAIPRRTSSWLRSKASAPPCNGPVRQPGIRASAPRPVAQPSPRGQMQRAREAVSKLTVVRRTWAGHRCRSTTAPSSSASQPLPKKLGLQLRPPFAAVLRHSFRCQTSAALQMTLLSVAAS